MALARPPPEAFIGPTYYWNQRWSSSSSAPPIPVGNQLRFYFGGRTGAHTHVKQGPIQYGVVGMATITEDRFVSLSAGVQDGKLLTKPLTWPGGDLLLNASTTRHHDGYPLDGGGALFVEVLDESGAAHRRLCRSRPRRVHRQRPLPPPDRPRPPSAGRASAA